MRAAFLWCAALGTAAALAAIAVPLAGLRSSDPRLTAWIARTLSDSVPGRVGIGALRWRGVRTLELHGLCLYDADGRVVASLERAVVPIGLQALGGHLASGPIRAAGVFVDLRTGRGDEPRLLTALPPGDGGDAELAWSLTVAELRRARAELPNLEVRAQRLEGHATGEVEVMAFGRGVRVLPRGRPAAPLLDSMAAHLRVDPETGHLTIHTLHAASAAGTLAATGGLDAVGADLNANGRDLDVGRLAEPWLVSERLPRRAAVRAAIDGRWDALGIEAEAVLEGVEHLGRLRVEVTGARVHPAQAELGRIVIEHPAGSAALTGAVPIGGGCCIEVDADVEVSAPEALGIDTILRSARADAVVGGTFGAPRAGGDVEAALRLDPGTGRDLNVVATARVDVDSEALVVTALEASGDASASGHARVAAPFGDASKLDAEVDFGAGDAGAFIPQASGALEAGITAAGTLAAPRLRGEARWRPGAIAGAIAHDGLRLRGQGEYRDGAWTGAATLEGDAIDIGGQPAGELEARLDAGAESIVLDASLAGGEVGRVDLSAKAPTSEPQRYTASLRLAAVPPGAWLDDLGGSVEADLDLRGVSSGRWPGARGEVVWRRPSYWRRPLGRDVAATLRSSRGGPLPYKVEGASAPGWSFEGALDPALPAWEGTVTLRDAPVPLPPRLEAVHGMVSGTVAVEAGATGVEIDGEMERAIASTPAGMVATRAPFTLRFAEGDLWVTGLRIDAGTTHLRGAWSPGRRWLRGDVDAGLIGPFVPQLANPSGRLVVDLTLGPELAPRGQVVVDVPVAFDVRALRRRFELEAGEARFTAGGVDLVGVRGRSGSAVVGISGRIELDDALSPTRFDLVVDAQRLRLRRGPGTVELDAAVGLVGPDDALRLQGDVTIGSGRYVREVRLRDLALEAVGDEAPPREPLGPPWRDVALELRSISRAPFELRVDAGALTLETALEADVEILGTLGAPRPHGIVRAVGGTLTLPASELGVVDGRIELDGTSERISFVAEGEVEAPSGDMGTTDYWVQLGLEGDLEQLRLDASASPSLPPRQVILLATTGRAELGGGDDAGSLDTALALAGDQVAGPVTGFIEDRVNDLLDSNVELSTEVATTGVRVGAATELTPRLELEGWYEQGIGDAPSMSTGTARLLLSDRFFFEAVAAAVFGEAQASGSFDDEGGSRLELRYRLLGE